MNNPSVIPAFDFREMVQAKNGEVVTTSRKVAEYFGKRHGDVLRKIEQVKADCSNEFSRRNFASADYIDEQGKLRPMYSLTKDGWIMVVMGFTGKAAAAIKESYISAFNWMSDQLSRRLANAFAAYGLAGKYDANQSLLTYLAVNTIAFHQNGVPLEIKAVKWLKGRGVGGKDRMVAYTNDKKYIRYPLVPLQSVPVQYRGLYQIATYYGKLGAVEPVYKETLSYVDGI
ncbi:TPA_asm: DUF2184 domain-containing protein [Salmonella enterica subsp. enterica]|uniref:DUF2184 domain-containing protein n=1 Tax=Salmonella enterica I TaxID=59201 RepID=A0A3U2RW20_SALET|nr:hypothetical protein [Salmonella enterica subsp. enterica serovar Hessarek]EHI3794906.1 DUF2184 domain-containing protein [Salmonella enterica]HAB5166169.1 DUF2184 domain-containing protein [Salmonella enterica subsp. enterica]EBU7023358.1 hypothetical protein [Salmonella enterica subsp. enterica serovar Hessarek]EEN0965717.1 DUF2184 domain-containing protein [Salmonella enterica subsp. enterica serovar Hessarek]